MSRADDLPGTNATEPRRFVTTHWSLVLAAAAGESSAAANALEHLCRTYWYPLYAFCRRKGHDAEESADLTQEFLTRLLEKNFLSHADPSRGRFRTFLLTALERFLINEWTRSRRQKRGGGRTSISLDAVAAEDRYRLEPVETMTAERVYERRWAMTLLEQAMARLSDECSASGKGALFEAVKATLSGQAGDSPHDGAAARLGMTEGAVKTAVHRLRRRYGELVRAEIAQTVADPTDVEEEIRHLFTALG